MDPSAATLPSPSPASTPIPIPTPSPATAATALPLAPAHLTASSAAGIIKPHTLGLSTPINTPTQTPGHTGPATTATAVATAPGAGTTVGNGSGGKRVSSTCVTCRARKVRCDGRPEMCTNCERLGFACAYDDTPGAGSRLMGDHAGDGPYSAGSFSLPRRRVRQACQNCHSRKARCSGTMPKCDRCRIQGSECIYRPGKRIRGMGSVSSSNVGHGSENGQNGHSGGSVHGLPESLPMLRDDHLSDHSRSLSSDHPSPIPFGGQDHLPRAKAESHTPDDRLEAVAMRTFDNFFRHVHHLPMFSFLHRASLMQRYHEGLVDRLLLLALVGITTLLTDLGPGMRDYGYKCIDEAETLVLADLEKPSALRLQALVLIIKHRIYCRRFSSAFMLFSIASRFAAALRLNYENPRLCFLAQESRRRLMWSLFMIDSGVSGGCDDFMLWVHRPESIHIRLPCNERNFEYDLPEVTEVLQPPLGPDGKPPPLSDDIGFLALHIRVHLLRSRILQYTKRVAAGNPSPAELKSLPAKCAELQSELTLFASQLPSSFRWSEANVRLRAYSPRLCVFLMTHICWEQSHCDLYRVGLVDLREINNINNNLKIPPTPGMPEGQQSPAEDLTSQHEYAAFVRHCRRQAFEHARAMADMFALLLTLGTGVPVTDLDLPVCLYQCAKILHYCAQTGGADLGMSPERLSEMTKVCSRVLAQCAPTPAAMGVRADLEKLMTQGLSSSPVAPSSLGDTPDMPAPTPQRAILGAMAPGIITNGNTASPMSSAVSPLTTAARSESMTAHSAAVLSPSLDIDMVTAGGPLPSQQNGPPLRAQPSTTAPSQPPIYSSAQLNGQDQTVAPPAPTPDFLSTKPAPALSAYWPIGNGDSMSQGQGHPSNAFEGALDGFPDFGAEPFGLDAQPWLNMDWAEMDFTQGDMAV